MSCLLRRKWSLNRWFIYDLNILNGFNNFILTLLKLINTSYLNYWIISLLVLNYYRVCGRSKEIVYCELSFYLLEVIKILIRLVLVGMAQNYCSWSELILIHYISLLITRLRLLFFLWVCISLIFNKRLMPLLILSHTQLPSQFLYQSFYQLILRHFFIIFQTQFIFT